MKMKIKVGDKLVITNANSEHPFSLEEIVKVITIHPESVLYVRNEDTKIDGYIIKGEYMHLD